MSELFTSLPRQIYVEVDAPYVGTGDKPERAVWFGITSVPGRAWGLTLLLECGAIYSHVPPHAIAFKPLPGRERPRWDLKQAQMWDCFGYQFAVHEYAHLAGRDVECWIPTRPLEAAEHGVYLFTAQHFGDGWSQTPEQAKQYHFVALDNGRLTCLPANRILVRAPEFTTKVEWPRHLKRQTDVYSCE